MSTISNILRGNDFSLCIKARKVLEEETEPISFADFTFLVVYLTRTYTSERVEMSFEINDDGDIIVPVVGFTSATYGIEIIGVYNGNNWRYARHEVFRIVECAERSTAIDSETIAADVYIVNVSVGQTALTRTDMEEYIDSEMLIKNVVIQVDNETGIPYGSGSYSTNTLNLDLHNLKGGRGEQGTSAIWNADAEILTELEHSTGQATNRTMSQKAISDNLGVTVTQEEYDALTPETDVKYIIMEEI